MSNKHRNVLQAIFRDPPPSNLQWREVESLLHHLGAVVESGHGAPLARLDAGVEVVEAPAEVVGDDPRDGRLPRGHRPAEHEVARRAHERLARGAPTRRAAVRTAARRIDAAPADGANLPNHESPP